MPTQRPPQQQQPAQWASPPASTPRRRQQKRRQRQAGKGRTQLRRPTRRMKRCPTGAARWVGQVLVIMLVLLAVGLESCSAADAPTPG